MILTLANPKYHKAYDESQAPSRWQTHVVGEEIATLLQGCGIKPEVESDDSWTLLSWTDRRVQFWISIECVDLKTPSFRLDVGAGKRLLSFIPRPCPDSIFMGEPWFLRLTSFAGGTNSHRGSANS